MQLPELTRLIYRAAGVTDPSILPIIFLDPDGERLEYQDARVQMSTEHGMEMRIQLGVSK